MATKRETAVAKIKTTEQVPQEPGSLARFQNHLNALVLLRERLGATISDFRGEDSDSTRTTELPNCISDVLSPEYTTHLHGIIEECHELIGQIRAIVLE